MAEVYSWIFWGTVAAMLLGLAVAAISYVRNVREGSRITASVAMAQAAMAGFGLVALWLVHRMYF